jgi:mitochondrial import receptor subunit TOM40
MGETQSRPVVDSASKTGSSQKLYPKNATTTSTHFTNGSLPFPLLPRQQQQQQQPWLLQMISNPMKMNVTHCAEASTAPPPLPPPPLPPTTQSTTTAVTDKNTESAPPVDSIEAASQSVSAFNNPGPYEQAVHDGKRLVMIDTFDGFRCDINKQVSPFMAAIHSFHLGTTMLPDGRKSSYTFISQVADENGLLMARIDPIKGSLDGRIHKAVLGGLAMGKLQLAVTATDNKDGAQQANDTLMAEVDFGGNTWASNLKYGSMGGGLVYGMNYMQAIHPNVAAGGEGMYIASNGNFVSSYSMKFNWKAKVGTATEDMDALIPPPPPPQPGMPPAEEAGQSMICCNYNTGQMVATVNYKRCVTPNRLVLGAELQFSPMTLDSQVLLGAEYKWQRSKLNLCIDGAGRIQSLLEAKYGMAPGSPSISLSAEMDHYSDIMKFGYGINIES